MTANPVYWPEARGAREVTNRNIVIGIMRASPKDQLTTREIAKGTRKPIVAVRSLLTPMANDGEIIRVKPGVFALPERARAQAPYRGGRKAVLDALNEAAGHMTTAQLVSATGLPRSTIDAANFRLVEERQIFRVRPGVFALSRSRTATGPRR